MSTRIKLGLRLRDDNSLLLLRPDLLEEWDYEKNEDGPETYTIKSSKMVFWKCKKCDNCWQARIVNRTRKYEKKNKDKARFSTKKHCPMCDSFGALYPEIAKEWSNKNTKTVFEVGRSKYLAIWECKKCGFEWSAEICSRINGYGNCPKCNSFGVKCPFLLKEWDFSRNIEDVNFINYGSTRKYWWKCIKCSHEWIATVASRMHGNGCPKCSSVVLSDGHSCDSMTEAYFYLKFKEKGLNFIHNKKYTDIGSMKNYRFDFYFPEENKYIEVTSFHKKSRGVKYFAYLRNIVKKKIFVENTLKAKFEFIQFKLNKSNIAFVREHMV